MKAIRTYESPGAFKTALETKLKERAKKKGTPLDRTRQRFVMERFLTRMITMWESAVILKGGLALELRLSEARSTKDVDVRIDGFSGNIFAMLKEAAKVDSGDWLSFTVDINKDGPTIDAVYEGERFQVSAQLASKPYGNPFGVDVGVADKLYGKPETQKGEDYLEFIGVRPLEMLVYPLESHIAEKLHAYTRSYGEGINSRVKDLPDIALLAGLKNYEAIDLRNAIKETFTFRRAHAMPSSLPLYPDFWAKQYETMARENGLKWKDINAVFVLVQRFLAPVFASVESKKVWNPSQNEWEEKTV